MVHVILKFATPSIVTKFVVSPGSQCAMMKMPEPPPSHRLMKTTECLAIRGASRQREHSHDPKTLQVEIQ